MSTNRTENYQLHAWGAEDEEMLGEINENFGIIDDWLGEKAEVVIGSYTGTGEEVQFIDLGFRPKALLITDKEGFLRTNSCGFYTEMNHMNHRGLYFTETGFRASEASTIFKFNAKELSPYVYLAVR